MEGAALSEGEGGGGGSTMRDGVGEGSALGEAVGEGAVDGDGDGDAEGGAFGVQPAKSKRSVKISTGKMRISMRFFIVKPRL